MHERLFIRARGQRWLLLFIVLTALVVQLESALPSFLVRASDEPPKERGCSLEGRLLDPQGQPIHGAEVLVVAEEISDDPVAHTESQDDGSYLLDLPPGTFNSVVIRISRSHFFPTELHLTASTVTEINAGHSVRLPDLTLKRRLTPGFWVATISFVLVLVLIALERLHKTTAALLGMALVLGFSLVGGTFNPDLFIFDFKQALEYVDFDVIFLVMGMMIVIGVIEETGIFQWLAYQAYRLSRGKVWLLVSSLMIVTSFASALLDNVTTMLLMAPITIEIALAVGINPLSVLLPEVLASNVGGTATLIGDPPNILIGSYAGLGFSDFLLDLAPGVLVAEVALILYIILRYRREHHAGSGQLSAAMLKRLRESGRITQPEKLIKAGIIFLMMLILFILGDVIDLVPAVTAILGAVAMLLWVASDIEEMVKVVDWTTLIFFIALFVLVGALQEIGLIGFIAAGVSKLVGSNPTVAILVLVWSAVLLSAVIDNVPFTATMLPVVAFLNQTVPGVENGVLWYALSVGAGMGGNSTLIGASPNLVTAGISERAGFRVTYLQFLKIGLPATVITVTVSILWLFLHF